MKKKYIYGNSQILAQHDVPDNNEPYFYLHDRLGSVRLVIDDEGDVVNSYTYNAFGESFDTETAENVSNPFKFTGQFFDSEIGQYYLRARMYDPVLGRFTSRDPVLGKSKEPLTLHRYLYCINDPINRTDLTGEWSTAEISCAMGIQGFVLGSILGGVKSAVLDEPIWKGAVSGGISTGVPAFLGVYGVAAGMMAGGLNSGISAGLDRQTTERIFPETLAGVAIGGILYGVTSWSIDNFMYANLIPAEFSKDFHKLFDPLMGSAGSDIVQVLNSLWWGDDEDEESY